MELSVFPWLERDDVPRDTISLRNVFLHVTKACNLHCSYCYFSASKPLPDEMTTDEFARMWEDMVALRPHKVILTGGELLLRPDILDLLRGLKAADPQHHVLRCLNTNGHLVTRELARELVGLADEVRVSIDALAARNDALRGQGNFDVAMCALEEYYRVGFEPKVLVTVTQASLPDLTDLLVLLISKKLTRININLFRPIGRGKGHSELRVNPAEVRAAVRRAWERAYPDKPIPPDPIEPDACTNCGVGSFLNIMPNGDVFPCHVLTDRAFRAGNVRESSLHEICQRAGLLGRLSRLDFRELAERDPRLVPLAQPHVCMGNVYADTKTTVDWNTLLVQET